MPKYPNDQTYFYISGKRYITNKGYDLFLGKIRVQSSTPTWIKSYGSASNEDVGRMIIDSNALYIYMIGTTLNNALLGSDIFYAKFDSNGGIVKFMQQGCASNDFGQQIILDRYNTTLFSVSSSQCFKFDNSNPNGNIELAFQQHDLDLNVQWSKYMGTSRNDQVVKMIGNPEFNEIMLLVKTYNDTQICQAVLVYLDYYGETLWAKYIGGDRVSDYFNDGIFSPDGRYFYVIASLQQAKFRTANSILDSPFAAIIKIKISDKTILDTQYYDPSIDTKGFLITSDVRNNFVIAGAKLKLNSYYQGYIVKFQSTLQDWGCFKQRLDFTNFFDDLYETWKNTFHPNKFESYDTIFSQYQVEDEISQYSLNSMANSWNSYSNSECSVSYFVAPQESQYYYYFQIGSIARINYQKRFYYCKSVNTPTTITLVAMEYTRDSLPAGLQQDSISQQIKGTPTAQGTFDIIFESQIFDSSSSQTYYLSYIVTVKILPKSGPIELKSFFMSPDEFRILYPYEYTFQITDFFSFPYSEFYSITTKVRTANGFNVAITNLPSWLKFDDKNLTFYGTPQKSDYPTAIQFPIELQIFLLVTDIYNQQTQSSLASLSITNFQPYLNNEIIFPEQICLQQSKTFFYKFPLNTFIDDDKHALIYTLRVIQYWAIPVI
ncbi:alkaline phosphatase [Stylonychia lemnae]|uniref:Alkaline phosphatase n=1 Tax=Stylonychia lemnae TaxID=5949 RepID=A0A078A6F7_STYLE|nr:alkaline phosphatase [Stylonychia lemnae]|eukprot:CDW77160.1 alkaline phosphatase [Stylonychia lemnae]